MTRDKTNNWMTAEGKVTLKNTGGCYMRELLWTTGCK